MNSAKRQIRVTILQIIGWCIVIGSTLYWSIDVRQMRFDSIMFMLFIAPLVVIYLINYKIAIPRLLFERRYRDFFIFNALLIVVLLAISHLIKSSFVFDLIAAKGLTNRPPRNVNTIFLVRDVVNYSTMVGLASAIRLIERLRVNEEALKVAESARIKSELANLRSQINPHFLLNTLNNIYSLTIIDVERAQKAIQELSRLLQYVLYDNTSDKVPLVKEVEFIKNYIELMRIRLNANVKLSVEIRVEENSTTQIAPLLFISLIENAFKHGVGADDESYITILFEDRIQEGEVVLTIANSNNAKSKSDKSGSGVGLEQVKRRLELQYPHNYVWERKSDNKQYFSKLTLKV